MKRKLALILAGVMLLAAISLLGACNNDSGGDPTTPPTTDGGSGENPTTEPVTTEGGSGGPNKGGTIIVRAIGDPISFQPNTVPDDNNFAALQNIYSRLVKLDSSKNIIPDLAKEWSTSEDGLEITFKLVENAQWHDGTPVTSKDVKYTFDVVLENPTYFAYESVTNVESISTPDDYTVVFHMSQPDVSLIGYLGWYATFILPEHIFNNGQEWDDNPYSKEPTVGSGPFKFVSYDPGVSITLERNDNYFQNEVMLDRVIYTIIPDDTTAVQALINGEIDILETVPDNEIENARAAGVILEENQYPSPMYLAFNFKSDYVTDYPIRLAIAQCVNREEICNKVYNNVRSPEYNFYPSISWASNSNAPAPAYDIEGAIQTLENAGYTKDSDGYYVRGIEIICYTFANTADMAKLIQANCKEAGIEIIVTPMESQAWSQIVWDNINTETGNFKTALMGGFQGPDPAALKSRISTGALNNIGAYSNERIDELFPQALISDDQAVRKPIYDEIQQIMSEELPIIPIINYACFDAQSSNVRMSPIQSAGLAGWSEYSYTYFAD